jgi:ribosomal protein S18 acetylase RimI-like enzyme
MVNQLIIYRNNYFKIERISEGSLSQVLKVYKQCEDFLALGPEPCASEEMVIKDIEHSVTEDGLFCGIFDSHDDILGIVDFVPHSCKDSGDSAFISLIMIAKPYRNKGLGAKVIEAIETYIRKYPQNKAVLSAVQTNNEKAIRFWKALGYIIVGRPELQPDKTTVYNIRKYLYYNKC